GGQGVGHVVDGVGQGGDLALRLHGQPALEVAVGDRGDDPGDASPLVGQVARHHVDVVGEVLPDPGNPADVGLAAQLAVAADLAGDAGDLAGGGVELVDHDVDRVLELEDLAADVDGDLLAQVAVGDRGGDGRDVAHLGGEVAGHEVDVVGEVLPDPGNAAHLGLTAQLALAADLAGDAGDLAGEVVELVDGDVDGVLELEDLTADVDGDLLAQVAVGDRGGDLGDVAHLAGEVAGH